MLILSLERLQNLTPTFFALPRSLLRHTVTGAATRANESIIGLVATLTPQEMVVQEPVGVIDSRYRVV